MMDVFPGEKTARVEKEKPSIQEQMRSIEQRINKFPWPQGIFDNTLLQTYSSRDEEIAAKYIAAESRRNVAREVRGSAQEREFSQLVSAYFTLLQERYAREPLSDKEEEALYTFCKRLLTAVIRIDQLSDDGHFTYELIVTSSQKCGNIG